MVIQRRQTLGQISAWFMVLSLYDPRSGFKFRPCSPSRFEPEASKSFSPKAKSAFWFPSKGADETVRLYDYNQVFTHCKIAVSELRMTNNKRAFRQMYTFM